MRGCLSYEIVSLIKRGATPEDACREALRGLTETKLALGEDAGSISLIALSPDGRFGAATTLDCFPFATAHGAENGLFAADSAGRIRPVAVGDIPDVD